MIITITWLVIIVIAMTLYLRRKYSVFAKAGVNSLPAVPFFGHSLWTFLKYENHVEPIARNVSAFPDDKVVGHYEMASPVYLVKDVELIKKVTIKDFEHFVDRRKFAPDSDPFFGRGLLLLRGDEWKEMRSSLSPAFTSSKIRLMVPFMAEVGEEMNKSLHQKIKASNNGYIDINIKELTTRYATDVLASCVYGIKVNSQLTDSEFYINGKEATNLGFYRIAKFLICKEFPSIAKMLNIHISSTKSANYFSDVVSSTMKYREQHNILRHDMINILLELKKGTLEHDEEADTNAGFATVEESNVGKKKYKREWSESDLVSQATLFLIAGYDSVSTAINFIIHELAVNPDVQEKLIKEIKEHEKNGGTFDYNSIQSMKYLDMVVSESLRLYPPATFLDRICVKDYNFGRVNNTSDKDLIVRKGDSIGLPIWAFHRDPKLFPDPLKFDPERFSDENKHNIKPFSYMPFGLGPRNCIASRFALCEMKVMLYLLIREMKLSPCERTNIPVKLIGGFTMNINDGGWIRVEARN